MDLDSFSEYNLSSINIWFLNIVSSLNELLIFFSNLFISLIV